MIDDGGVVFKGERKRDRYRRRANETYKRKGDTVEVSETERTRIPQKAPPRLSQPPLPSPPLLASSPSNHPPINHDGRFPIWDGSFRVVRPVVAIRHGLWSVSGKDGSGV